MISPVSSIGASLSALGSVSLDAHINAQEPLEARVIEMIGGDRARLNILGTTIEVQTSVQLVPGAILKLKLDEASGRTRLIIQPNEPNRLPPSPAAIAPPAQVSVQAQSAIIMMLADAARGTRLHPHVAASYVSSLFKDVVAENNAEDERQLSIQPSASADLLPPGGGLKDTGNAGPPPSHHICILLKDSEPIILHLVREDRPEDLESEKRAAGQAWSIQFSFETPDGAVQTRICQSSTDGMSVHFSTASSHTASRLNSQLSELQAALAGEAIDINSLTVVTNVDEGAVIVGGRDERA